MSFSITSSEPAFNKTKWGDIPKLTHTNYDEWKDDMILILTAMKAYAIVTGDDPEPQSHDFDHDDNYDDWKAKEAEAGYIIRLSYSPKVQRIVKGIRNPHEIWNILETSLDTAGSSIGRQDILRQFRACRSKEDEPLKAYFTKLSNYCIQLDHTDDAITNNGGAVLRQSRKQGLISMSTLEAEFIACSEASRDAKWLLQLQKDIHGEDLPPLPINCDNKGALALITTRILKARTKHMNVCYHNSQDLHKRRIVSYSYVHTDKNVADVFTKALTKEKHMKITNAMGLWLWRSIGGQFKVVSLFFWEYRCLCLYGLRLQ